MYVFTSDISKSVNRVNQSRNFQEVNNYRACWYYHGLASISLRQRTDITEKAHQHFEKSCLECDKETTTPTINEQFNLEYANTFSWCSKYKKKTLEENSDEQFFVDYILHNDITRSSISP